MFKFLKIFTLKRFSNFLLIQSGLFLSRISKSSVILSLPFSLTLEPTNQCNLKCPECPSGSGKLTRGIGQMDVGLFKKVIDETSPFAFHLMIYFQGEPYLHPQFTDMVDYAKKKRFYITTSTNAHFLAPANARKTIISGLDKIIISLDGTTQEVYKTYRIGGNLQKVLEGIDRLVRMKKELKSKTPLIELQFLVFKFNEHQMEDAKRLAKNAGVDRIRFKTAQIYNFEKIESMLPSPAKYARYVINPDKTVSLRKKLRNRCKRLWTSSVITYDGNVVPCCYDKDGTYCMGNVSGTSFKTIWKNDPYMKFRARILHDRKGIDICRNCW